MKIFNSLSNKLYAFVISISLFFFVPVTLPRIFGNHKEWYAIHKNNHTSFGYVNTLTKVIGNNCTLAIHKLFDKITVFVYNSCIYEKKNILNNILRPGYENIRSAFIQLPCVEVTEHFFFFFLLSSNYTSFHSLRSLKIYYFSFGTYEWFSIYTISIMSIIVLSLLNITV